MPVTRPLARTDLEMVELDGEAVIYDRRTKDLHYLNQSSALVFDLCDGATTMKEMAVAIADVYQVVLGGVERQVRGTVRELRKRGLLTGKGEPAERQEEETDRRERVRMDVPRSS